MNGSLRSKQGCWTCRLRKKKCDEIRPKCSICESLIIECYGYGSKPEWMDGGEKERGVSNSFKEIVKRTSRRKGTTILEERVKSVRIAPKYLLGTRDDSSPSQATHLASIEASRESAVDMGDEPVTSRTPPIGDYQITYSISATPPDEFVFLMHFLDHVFPLQYPMYISNILEGGRGWLLYYVLHAKPYYYAALALSAYHRRNSMSPAPSKEWQVNALVQQEKFLEICLQFVTGSTKNSCPAHGLGITTAVLQLFFYELYTGDGPTWQAHLHAATRMFQKCHKYKLTNLGIMEASRIILVEDLPLSEHDELVVIEVAIFRFLTATLIWLGITYSITSGTISPLLTFHQTVLAPISQTKLEDIMGCQNWVMFHIGRVSALYDKKTKALQEGQIYPSASFSTTADAILKEIQCGIIFKNLHVDVGDSTIVRETKVSPSIVITRMFAYMAIIYAHLVIHDFENMERIEATIFEATSMLRHSISKNLLPALVAPLYVIGCVAKEGDEEFFQESFSSRPLMDPLLAHRGRVLPVLEQIWRRRRTATGVKWKDCLELTHNLLLI